MTWATNVSSYTLITKDLKQSNWFEKAGAGDDFNTIRLKCEAVYCAECF